MLWAVVSIAQVNLYVNTDTGSNLNNGTSWTLAKKDLYHALAAVPRPVAPATLQASYVIHCKGATPDTVMAMGYNNGTTPTSTVTIQTDLADRPMGVWDDTKYHLVVTDTRAGLVINNAYENVYGLQIKAITLTGSYLHGIVVGAVPSGVVNLAYNIIQGEMTSGTDDGGIHTSRNSPGTVNIWNNVIYGWANGSNPCLAAISASSRTNIFNNTVYDSHIGIYDGSGTVGELLSINNLFVDVSRPLAGNSPGMYAAGTNYNATDGPALLISPMTVQGGDGLNEQVGISTWGLFMGPSNGNFNLTPSSSYQVVGAGVANPGGGLFGDDITGATRTYPWDIGAFKWKGH
jgi:hypothetical protein